MEEHRQRVSAATNATTLGQLQSLVDDLQISAQPQPLVTRPSKLRSPAVVFAAIAAGVALLLGAVAWAVMGGDDAPAETTASPTAVPEKHALAAEPTIAAPESTTTEAPQEPSAVVLAPVGDLHTADGITRVVDEMRKRFGDTMGYELAIMSDQAMLAKPDPANDQSKLIYTFKQGWEDMPRDRPRSDTDDLTDLAAFDIPAAAAALQAAPETLKIAPGDVAETFIDVDHIAEPPGPGALELLIKVTTADGKDGWIYLDPAGAIKRVEDPS